MTFLKTKITVQFLSGHSIETLHTPFHEFLLGLPAPGQNSVMAHINFGMFQQPFTFVEEERA
jgi:hypothetical protein